MNKKIQYKIKVGSLLVSKESPSTDIMIVLSCNGNGTYTPTYECKELNGYNRVWEALSEYYLERYYDIIESELGNILYE